MVDRIGPYVVLQNSKLEPKAAAGTVVFRPNGWDYGSANDDTRVTGVEHISVTLDADGDYPFFTIPMRDLRMAEPSEIEPTKAGAA
jgi:hypothetical protein